MGFHVGFSEANLDEWIEADMNVLIDGLHGTGKSTRVIQAFQKHFGNMVPVLDDQGAPVLDERGVAVEKYEPGVLGVDFLYFSCATLDPWVDLVGVPRETTAMIDGEEVKYLDLVRPFAIATGRAKAIFLDEFNRAPKKVRNAVMELLQFRSINGLVFPNLRLIWAAINPEEDASKLEFDVEPLDPAQKDRFDIQVSLEYRPDADYFLSKYGSETSSAAIDWWTNLPESVKLEVSPRRLDKVIDAANRGLSLRHMLPVDSNPQKLQQALKNGFPEKRFRALMAENDIPAARKWLAKSNNIDAIQKIINTEDAARRFALPLIDTERLAAMLARQSKVKEEVLSNPYQYRNLIREMAAGSQNTKLKSDCQKLMGLLDSSTGDESLTDLRLNIKSLPVTISPQEIASLESNYQFNDKATCCLDGIKNGSGEPLYPPFTQDFEREARSMTYFCNSAATNTYYRNQHIEALARLATKVDMSRDEVLICLRFFEFFASHSNSKSIYSRAEAAPILNTLVREYRRTNPGAQSSDLFKIIPNVYYRYFGSNAEKDATSAGVIDYLSIQPKPASDQVNPTKIESLQDIEI